MRSPAEYFIKYLISRELKLLDGSLLVDHSKITREQADKLDKELFTTVFNINTGLSMLAIPEVDQGYILHLAEVLRDRLPKEYRPNDKSHAKTREYLRRHKIFDLWHPSIKVQEAKLILADTNLRDKLEPLLLSSMSITTICRKLKSQTQILITPGGVSTYGHYFWNRDMLTKGQWVEFLSNKLFGNKYVQSLMTSPDVAGQHLPWIVGISGPPKGNFNTADSAMRMAQIAHKYALELENRPATLENTNSLRNCIIVVEKASTIMQSSDKVLAGVIEQFQKFRMKLDDNKVGSVKQISSGNHSESADLEEVEDGEDF